MSSVQNQAFIAILPLGVNGHRTCANNIYDVCKYIFLLDFSVES
jgi:hypothetical protein